MASLTPKPQVYPACSSCEQPYVLRRSLIVKIGDLSSMREEWIWQRDCKHKRTPAKMVDLRRKKGSRKRPVSNG